MSALAHRQFPTQSEAQTVAATAILTDPYLKGPRHRSTATRRYSTAFPRLRTRRKPVPASWTVLDLFLGRIQVGGPDFVSIEF